MKYRVKRFGTKKPTITELQMQFRAGMPDNQDPSKLPAFMHETPRTPRATPNRHDEKKFVDRLLKLCGDYYKTGLKKIWLRKNSNGVGRTFDGKGVIHYGLGAGVGDCVGYVVKTVTQDMVGKQIAVYAEVEAKLTKGGVISEIQQFHHDQIIKDGGIALFAYDQDGEDAVVKALECVP